MNFSPMEPNGEEVREVAVWRWKAVEAFLSHPGLSPLASRLGAKLIAIMNARTRVCYPSEVRLATELNASRRGLQQAKAELRSHGLIDWETPNGPRGGAYYTFNFELLDYINDAAKTRGEKAVADQQSRFNTRPKSKLPVVQGEVQCAIEPVQGEVRFAKEPVTVASPDTSKAHSGASQSEVNAFQGEVQCAYMAKRTSPYLTQYITQEILSTHHASQSERARVAPATVAKQQHRRSFYPKLLEEFGKTEALIDRINSLDFNDQDTAAKMLAQQGRQRAAAFLNSRGVEIGQGL